MSRIDPNANTQERCRRNWQRVADPANFLSLSANGGLEYFGGSLQINLNGVSLALSASGINIAARDFGDITTAVNGETWTIDNDVVTFAKMQNIATDTLIGRDSASTGDPESITLSDGLEFSGSSSIRVNLASPSGLEFASGELRSLTRTLFTHFADAGNTGTTETDLYSDTLAASQLAANGDRVDAEYGLTLVNSATATRQIRVYFAGTLIFDTGALTLSASSSVAVYVSVMRVNGTTVRYTVAANTTAASTAAYATVGEITGLTLSATNILKITGTAAGVGAATNDIVAKHSAVTFFGVL